MKDINIVCITGRAVKDSELKTINAQVLLSFTLAFNRSVNKNGEYQDEPNFINCALWGKIGQSLVDKILKGVPCTVHGELRHNRWEDKDGTKRNTYEIIVKDIRIATSKNTQSNNNAPSSVPTNTGGGDIDDDIPF